MRKFLIGAALLIIGLPSVGWTATDAEKIEGLTKQLEAAKRQAAIVGSELKTIANTLALRPDIPKDFSKVSGEYCFFGGWGGHHTHYAIDPTKTQEDVIDFVGAEPLIKAGVNAENLPRFPGKLGAMTPNQWYFLPAGGLEPHHGKKVPVPLLIRAVNVK